MKNLENFKYVLVSDGTTVYIIDASDLDYEIEENEVSVIGYYNDIDKAAIAEEKEMQDRYPGYNMNTFSN